MQSEMKPKVMAMQMMDEEMPCMSLSSDDLKEIKDWKTGEILSHLNLNFKFIIQSTLEKYCQLGKC